MKILITGGREYINNYTITEALMEVTNEILWDSPKKIILVHGACRGADMLADKICRSFGVEDIRSYPADWDKLGKAAGFIRNQEMLDKEKPDICLAFHSDISKSKGTLDMIKRANKAGIEVRLYS